MTFDTTTLIIILGVLAAIVLVVLMLRSGRGRARVERRPEGESPYVAATERPYMKKAPPREGAGVADELGTATADVAGEVLGVPPRHAPPGAADDLSRLKGVGPKFVARLNELGIARYDQLAGLNANEAAHLDERLGPFQGRLARDRIVEQAHYLARGDTEEFEEKFGKLGG
jgi:predicted flap endonuclease-1-like 5' DNA nuclease